MAAWGPVDWSVLVPSSDAENTLTGASPAVLAAMSDCELFGHPICDGECPCGQVVRPVPLEPAASPPVTFHEQVSVWWRGVPGRQTENRPRPQRPMLPPRVQRIAYP